MNKEKQLEFIARQRKEHSGLMDEYREGYFKCLDDFESKIQLDPEEPTITKSEIIKAINDWWKYNETGYCSYYFFQFRQVVQNLYKSKYGEN